MVRVPGSFGDLGFHLEPLRVDVKIKTEPGMEASEADGWTQTREFKGLLDHQGFGRGPDERKLKEEYRLVNLEDKTRPRPQVLLGMTADHATKYDPPSVNYSSKTGRKLHKTSQETSKTMTVKTEEVRRHQTGSSQLRSSRFD